MCCASSSTEDLCLYSEVNITCAASGVDVVTIDCNDLNATLECSFNSGLLHPCEQVKYEHNIT